MSGQLTKMEDWSFNLSLEISITMLPGSLFKLWLWCVGRITVQLNTLQINESAAQMSLKQFCLHFQVSALIVKLSSSQCQIHSTGSEVVNAEQIILVFNSADTSLP